jgi:hypothetical protein
MFRNTIVAAGLALAMVFGAPAPAKADVDISINLGFGGFYGKNISCQTGARIVDRRFSRVRIQSCAGKNYDYTGRRNGKNYWIKVNRSTGRIVEVRRIA